MQFQPFQSKLYLEIYNRYMRKKYINILWGRNGQKGSAVLVFISILFVASVLTGYMIDFTTTSTYSELSYNHLERAYFIAEAGGQYQAADRRQAGGLQDRGQERQGSAQGDSSEIKPGY